MNPDSPEQEFDSATNDLVSPPESPLADGGAYVVPDLVESPNEPSTRPNLSFSGWFAWLFVLLFTTVIVSLVAFQQFTSADQVGGDLEPKELMPIQLQGKMIVAQKQLSAMQQGAAASSLPPSMDSGPYEQRLCYTVLLNELDGAADALEHLEQTDEAVADAELELTEDQTNLRAALLNLLEQYDAGDLDSSQIPQADQDLIKSKLQWLGKLALLPEDTPLEDQRSELESEAMGMMTFGVVGFLSAGFFAFIGFLLAVVLAILFFTKKLTFNFSNAATNLNIYIETFAIWMGLFFGSSFLLSYFQIRSDGTLMIIQPMIFFGSLAALVWPIVRGVSFSQMRKDIGWTAGNPFKEASTSFVFYPATVIFLIPGIILVSIIMAIMTGLQQGHEFARQSVPSHPIQEYLADGNATMMFFVFFTACVCAPIVEETMFRGVLYRHLRDLSGRWSRWISVLFSAVFNGLIFASIHPQGLVGIPLLTTLAIGFSLAREWRDSLICPMVMHAIHNTLVTCVVLLIL